MSHYQIHFQATSSRRGKQTNNNNKNSQWQGTLGNVVFVMAGMCLAENQRFYHYVKKGYWEKLVFSEHIDINVVKNISLQIILLGTWQDLLPDNYYSGFSFQKYCLLPSFTHQKQ